MPKILCKSNMIIQLGEIPCPHEYLYILDQNYDQYSAQIDAEELYKELKSVILCPECKRLLIFHHGWVQEPIYYKLE